MNFFLYVDKRFFQVLKNLRFWKIAFQKFRVILPKELLDLAFSFCLIGVFGKFFNIFKRELKLGHVECTSARRNLPFRLFMDFHKESIMFLVLPSFITRVANVDVFTE
jgi:hypothetical protein